MSWAIEVENIGKRYTIGAQKKDSTIGEAIKDLFLPSRTSEEFWALDDLNFKIKSGEVVGIIGRNGAGKSTLLKLLSRITVPSKGKITIDGRLASLLEVGTGFHPELTGKENIYLNGTILGMRHSEITAKLDDIIEFSGIQKFLNTPVKRYSSGMYVRLAFSVAAHLEPEILVIDEVLAVGDAEFQKKCLGKMGDVAKSGRTVLFVSHNIGLVKSLCTRGILLESGKIISDGQINDVIDIYQKRSLSQSNGSISFEILQSKDVSISQIELFNSMNRLATKLSFQEPFLIKTIIHSNVDFKSCYLVIGVETIDGTRVWTSKSNQLESTFNLISGSSIRVDARFANILTPGTYNIYISVRAGKGLVLDTKTHTVVFEVENDSYGPSKPYSGGFGTVYINPEWSINDLE